MTELYVAGAGDLVATMDLVRRATNATAGQVRHGIDRGGEYGLVDVVGSEIYVLPAIGEQAISEFGGDALERLGWADHIIQSYEVDGPAREALTGRLAGLLRSAGMRVEIGDDLWSTAHDGRGGRRADGTAARIH